MRERNLKLKTDESVRLVYRDRELRKGDKGFVRSNFGIGDNEVISAVVLKQMDEIDTRTDRHL